MGAAQSTQPTMTSIASIEVFHTVNIPITTVSGLGTFDLFYNQNNQPYESFELNQNDGFGIRVSAAGAAVIGLGISGSVEWDER